MPVSFPRQIMCAAAQVPARKCECHAFYNTHGLCDCGKSGQPAHTPGNGLSGHGTCQWLPSAHHIHCMHQSTDLIFQSDYSIFIDAHIQLGAKFYRRFCFTPDDRRMYGWLILTIQFLTLWTLLSYMYTSAARTVHGSPLSAAAAF